MTVQDKAVLNRIHSKFYANKKSKKVKQEERVVKVIKDKKALKAEKIATPEAPVAEIKTGVGIIDQTPLGNTGEKAGSRADLMAQAQAGGIKYFRILTKEELTKVLADSISPQEITVIQQAAQARWKGGWTKKK